MICYAGENAACSNCDETKNATYKKGDDGLLENGMGHAKQDAGENDCFEVAAN